MNPQARPDPTLALAAAGDREARAELLERHGDRVWGLCRRLAREPEDAWQEIWEKVFRALPSFDPEGPASLGTWITVVAHRHLVDRARRRKVRGEVLELPELPSSDPDGELRASGRERQALLEQALARLPEAQRRVVVLHHLNGLALEAIAEEEGVALGTVKSRLHRARGRLARMLESCR